MRDKLLGCPVRDNIAIQAAEEELREAMAERETTRKGKSNGGSCGGDEDYRVDEAQANRKKLLEAPKQDPAAIKVAEVKLKLAVAKKEKTRKGKSDGGKYIHSKRSYSLFHSQQQFLTMSICCDFIISCTKGKTKAEESFDVLNGCFLQSERKGADFKVRLQ